MKKFVLVMVAVLALSATSVFADCGKCHKDCGCDKGPKPPAEMKAMMMQKMTEGLGLSEEQVGQVGALMEEKMDKKKAIKEEKREKMEALREEFEGKMEGILTEEQLEKFKKMHEEMKMKKGSMKGSGPGHMHKGSGHGPMKGSMKGSPMEPPAE